MIKVAELTKRMSSALLLLAASVPFAVGSAAPAGAATGCSFTSGSTVKSKSFYLKQASRTKTVTWDIGTTISADRFGKILDGATRPQSNQWGTTIGWFRSNGDYTLPVDMAKDSCRAIAIVTTGTNSHLWVHICVAPSPGRGHSDCVRSLPRGLSGLLYTGQYNGNTQKLATNPNGSLIRT